MNWWLWREAFYCIGAVTNNRIFYVTRTGWISTVANIFAAVTSCEHKNTDGAIKKDGSNKRAQAWWLHFFLKIENLAWTRVFITCLFTLPELCKLAFLYIYLCLKSCPQPIRSCRDCNISCKSVCKTPTLQHSNSEHSFRYKSHTKPAHFANSSLNWVNISNVTDEALISHLVWSGGLWKLLDLCNHLAAPCFGLTLF